MIMFQCYLLRFVSQLVCKHEYIIKLIIIKGLSEYFLVAVVAGEIFCKLNVLHLFAFIILTFVIAFSFTLKGKTLPNSVFSDWLYL